MKPDIYKAEYYGDDDRLFREAKALAKKLGRPVLIDYGGELMFIREDDKDFDPMGWIEAGYACPSAKPASRHSSQPTPGNDSVALAVRQRSGNDPGEHHQANQYHQPGKRGPHQ